MIEGLRAFFLYQDMITIIKADPLGAVLVSTEGEKIIKKSVLSVVKRLCEDGLFTHEGYLKAVKAQFGFRYQIPIYIHEQLGLIPLGRIRNHDTVWINVAAITGIKTSSALTIITMLGNQRFESSLSRAQIERRIHTLMTIRDVKVKHFHSVSCSKWPDLML
ncbi:MAG: competence protein ComK [Acholeplasmataceae bacterium]|nr:competence protein ComK [Acholeplasmataceae bacterium]